MTQDEIIEMANQAELCQSIWIDDGSPEIASLVAFAKLVAAKEREACAKIVELNADVCRSDGVAQMYLYSNATAIRARGEA
jgi:hypothetical protein